ncbi:hypothetical protein [Robertkochia solimangrovi]|uniref:hypothetical protein n=1 Tax=Robertkochia solimangrovi TaxID=2213046 RepID=UPI00118044EA|nr:hypothetical protein [Robertkochia solimangrovi]TRZ45742.1 hypothetical protein DMZ48_00220 [Robertkochia solimangrovi]
MKIFISFLTIGAFLLLSCGGATTKMTGSWKNPDAKFDKKYNSVFIAFIGSNVQLKNLLENELAEKVSAKGVKAVKSHDIFKQTFSKENMPTKEELLEEIKSTGCESIFTVTLKDTETSTRYVPGSTTYAPMGYGGYGRFYGYYSSYYPMTYDPGYYTEDKKYFVESNFYDTATEELVWSAQSATYNPTDYENFIEGYTKALADQLVKDGVIKKGL